MSLLFNMLSRFVITFLPRSKSLLISWLQSQSAEVLEPKKIVWTVSIVSRSICHEVMGPDAIIFIFWMLNFKNVSQSWRKSTLNSHWKDWCWSWSFSTLAIWCKEPTPWKRSWCWERLKEEEECISGWDGWMASPIQWTWTWANSRRWWGTGRSGVLQSMGLQRVGHDLATEQQQQITIFMLLLNHC